MSADAKRPAPVPKVSVVTPTYNFGRFLRESMQSVLDQTFRDWELIVVDDGSTDDSAEVVASFKDPRIIYLYQENKGVAAALNAGIRAARGEYVAFLDADDLWYPDKLAIQVEQLDNLPPSVGLVYCDQLLFEDRDGSTIRSFLCGRDPPRGRIFNDMLGRSGSFIGTSTILMRRAVFDQVGMFDEELGAHEDWELNVRIAAAYEIEALNQPLARARVHSNNLQRDVDTMYRCGRAAKLKVLNSYPLRPDQRRELLHSLAGLHYLYAIACLQAGQRRKGLRALARSLRLHPIIRRSYVQAALLLVSPRLHARLRAWKRRLIPTPSVPTRLDPRME